MRRNRQLEVSRFRTDILNNDQQQKYLTTVKICPTSYPPTRIGANWVLESTAGVDLLTLS